MKKEKKMLVSRFDIRFEGEALFILLTLLVLLGAQAGSRLYEAMLKADIGGKKREKLINKMKGHFAELAATKFGSRVVDKCWAQSEIKRKVILLPLLAGTLYALMFKDAVSLTYFTLFDQPPPIPSVFSRVQHPLPSSLAELLRCVLHDTSPILPLATRAGRKRLRPSC